MSELLERGDLLAQLAAFRAEGGRLVFVGGEAGVGKTALVRAFSDRVGDVARGSCESLAAPTPLGPFLDLGLEPGEPRAVAAAALGRGGVLVLEDVHWADGATLDVLRVLGRRVDGSGTLVIATYRDDEVAGDHPLRVVLGELASAPGVVRLAVPRLTVDAVRELAEPHGLDAEALHRLTLGNAFYVTEILAAGGDELPATVRDAVLARAALLDERRAQAARLRSRWCRRERSSGCSSRSPRWGSAGSTTASPRASFAPRATGSPSGTSSRASPSRRDRAAPAPCPARVDPRRARARRRPLAPRPPRRGGRRRRGGAPLRAGGGPRRRRGELASRGGGAVPASTPPCGRPAPRERAELLDGYAEEALLTGLYEESVEARGAALALYRELGDRLKTGETLSRLTNANTRLGRNREAEDASREAIEILETLPHGRELAWAYAVQAYIRMLSRDNEEGVAWGRKAVAAARAAGDLEVEAYGLNMVGTSLLMAGRIDEGVRELERSLALAGARATRSSSCPR